MDEREKKKSYECAHLTSTGESRGGRVSQIHSELNNELETTKAKRRAELRNLVCIAGISLTNFWNFFNFFAPSSGKYYFGLVYNLFPGFYSAILILSLVLLIPLYLWSRAMIMLSSIDKANGKQIVMSVVPYTTLKATPERLLKYESELLRTTDYLYGVDRQAQIFEPMYADWELELSRVGSDKWQEFKLNLYYGAWFFLKIWQRSGFISRYIK